MASAPSDTSPLSLLFGAFSRIGNTASDGSTITLDQVHTWMNQARLLGDRISPSETLEAFNKFHSQTLTYGDFLVFLSDIADTNSLSVDEIREELMQVTFPSSVQPTTDTTTSVTATLIMAQDPLQDLPISASETVTPPVNKGLFSWLGSRFL